MHDPKLAEIERRIADTLEELRILRVQEDRRYEEQRGETAALRRASDEQIAELRALRVTSDLQTAELRRVSDTNQIQTDALRVILDRIHGHGPEADAA